MGGVRPERGDTDPVAVEGAATSRQHRTSFVPDRGEGDLTGLHDRACALAVPRRPVVGGQPGLVDDRVVPRLGDLVRTELPDHLGHRGEQQQRRVVDGPSGLREGVRLRPFRVDMCAGRQGASGVPPGHLGHGLGHGHPRVPEGEHRVAPRGEPTRGAEHPLAERLALDRLPAGQRQPVRLHVVQSTMQRGSGRHRLAGDDVGGGDLHDAAVLAAHGDDPALPRLADAEHVGHRGASRRAGLARQHAAYDDAEADDVWPEASRRAGSDIPNLGRVISGHGGILGLPRPELDRTSGGSR